MLFYWTYFDAIVAAWTIAPPISWIDTFNTLSIVHYEITPVIL